MAHTFNVTGCCNPKLHYMVDITGRLEEIRVLVDNGDYFTINRARQYGKTTTIKALTDYLRDDYIVVSLDFQRIGDADFSTEITFCRAFAWYLLRTIRNRKRPVRGFDKQKVAQMEAVSQSGDRFTLSRLFGFLSDLCDTAEKLVVMIIDEVDSAANNQVFLDFLAQLRSYYIDRETNPTFQSVILAGVYDVKNITMKIRPESWHKTNSPWNIAADFTVDMSFSSSDIKGMLARYEADHCTGMDTELVAGEIYSYTSGYPFLVSRLCKLMDEEIGKGGDPAAEKLAWTRSGVNEAVRLILAEKNTLFDSLLGKLTGYPELNTMLRSLLFTGKSIVYNPDEPAIDMATMFGFIKNQCGSAVIANRIFETRLYNYYLSTAELQGKEIYKASLLDRNAFIVDGYLNMRMVLEKFTEHFSELYGDSDASFLEEEGRKYFLLYLRPIINGTGNYYIESRTRGLRRTDVIIDYRGEQYVVEMKIWHGNEYNHRGEEQLVRYLDDYHLTEGYMVSFNFNKKKETGVREIMVGGKVLVEAVV